MSVRTHVISAVFKRNLRSYFSGVIGYLFIVVFVGAGAFLSFRPEFFANNLANLDQLNKSFPYLLLFIVPAITMTTWSDERKLGTDELLFTLPATDFEILLGKYLSVLAIYTVALLFSMIFSSFGVLSYLTSTANGTFQFDKGLIFTNYLGYWLAGAALLSAGMVASILTSSATVAYIAGVLFCSIPVFIGVIFPLVPVLKDLSLEEQLRDFGLGMIPWSGVFYFFSLTVFMLYINNVFISKRHWSGGPHGVPMGFHFFVRGLALVLFLVGAQVMVSAASSRVDLTSAKLYTVYPTTRKAIKEIDKNRPVLIQAFISPTVPADYVGTRTDLIALLRQFDQIGGDKVVVRIVPTEPFTDAADEAKKFGIQPQQLQSQRAGKVFAESVYLGAVISSGADDEVVVPFFDVGTPLEYELTRSVQTVSNNKRLKVGILTTDAKLFGGFDMQTFSNSPEWRIVSELKRQYDVEQVSPDAPISGDYHVLIAAMPSSLTDPQLTNFVDYVKRGKPVLIFDDPLPVSRMALAPRQPKPAHGGGMFGQQAPPTPKADNGAATRLVDELGIAWDNGETVWDQYNPHPEFADVVRPEIVFISTKSPAKAAFSQRSAITSGLQEVVILFSGEIRPREGANTTFVPLLRTSPDGGALKWDELVESTPSFMGMGGPRIIENPPRNIDDVEHVVAAYITSGSKSADKKSGDAKDAAEEKPSGPGIKVVYVADLDMISDQMFSIRDKEWNNLQLDNVTFVLNAVDVLAGDDSLLDLRKRRAPHYTLSAVEQYTKEYVAERARQKQVADEEAKKKLEEARKRFADNRKKIEQDKTLDSRTRQIMMMQLAEEEQRRLEVDEAQIENEKLQKVQESKSQSERKIRAVESKIQLFAVLLPPIPALLLGLFVLITRLSAERRTIVSDRLVKS